MEKLQNSVHPPLAKIFLGQMDALNDCLVLENLSATGFLKIEKCEKESAELISHCNIVLKNTAKFHALSLAISRLEKRRLSEIFPFAVEAEGFRQDFNRKIKPLKDQLVDYLRWETSKDRKVKDIDEDEDLIERKIQELFWRLLKQKSRPEKVYKEVLIHGHLDFSSMMFK